MRRRRAARSFLLLMGDRTYPLLTSLVAYWSLDEASGQANDAHSNALHLTANNAPGTAAGKVGTSRSFVAASSQYFSRADEAALSAGDIELTLLMWVYLDTLGTVVLGGKGNVEIPTADEYELFYNAGTANFRFVVGDGAAQSEAIATTFGAPAAATWHSLLGQHDPAANLVGISVNNGTLDTAAHTTGILDGTASFFLGRSTGTPYYLNGRLDEVALWKRLLTSAERTFLYNSGAGRSYAEVSSYTARQILLENLLQQWWRVKGRRVRWAEALLPQIPLPLRGRGAVRAARSGRGVPAGGIA